MKRFTLFLVPLMAISFLTSCGGNKPDPTPGIKEYTVTFDLNGGTSEAIPTQTVKENEYAIEPNKPTKAKSATTIFTFNS